LHNITYSYTLDGAPSNGTLTGLYEGSHTFAATATDAAGNSTPIPISYTWTTDYTPPTVAFSSKVASPVPETVLTNVNLSLDGRDDNGISLYSYSIDDGSDSSTETGAITISDLDEGPHTLHYSATDNANNPSTSETLPFSLSRYTLTGAMGNGGGNQLPDSVVGEVAAVSNQDWGGWIINMPNAGGVPSSTLYAGGYGYKTSYLVEGSYNGYWLNKLSINTGTLSGTSDLTYLTRTAKGAGTGTVTGTFDTGVFNLTDTGIKYTETDLAFMSEINPELYYYASWGGLTYDGTLTGLLGGTESLWSASPYVTIIGEYDSIHGAPQPRIWYSSDIYSYNYNNSTKTTYAGGAYRGFMGGTVLGDVLDGKFLSLYIDPSGNAGYLSG
ncbi:MAG: hypothetical protein COX51_09500, partial [Syntrophobacteraceae bacterium CG23_combo_of_CG06-09_8_20_14_all_50_8]